MFTDFGTGTDVGLGSFVLTVVVAIVLVVLVCLVLGSGLQVMRDTLEPLRAVLG